MLTGHSSPKATIHQIIICISGQQYDPDLGLYYNRARYLNTGLGRFWTADTTEGNNKDPLSLHKYLYGADNPVNRIDPSGNDDIGDFDIGSSLDSFSFNFSIPRILTPLASGTWNIFDDVVPDSYGSIYTLKDRNVNGFQVQYNPSGGGAKGTIKLYQTIAANGFYSGFDPCVDVGGSPYNTAAKMKAKYGCGLPPTVPGHADTSYSYWDSPTSKSIFSVVYKITAVAVIRSGCSDTILSTYYFEFDNDSRKITKTDPGYMDNYNAAMKAWNQ